MYNDDCLHAFLTYVSYANVITSYDKMYNLRFYNEVIVRYASSAMYASL